jgi:hypothetical protein
MALPSGSQTAATLKSILARRQDEHLKAAFLMSQMQDIAKYIFDPRTPELDAFTDSFVGAGGIQAIIGVLDHALAFQRLSRSKCGPVSRPYCVAMKSYLCW